MQSTILEDNANNADADGGRGRSGLVTEDGEVLAYEIMRGTLQHVLHKPLANEQGLGVTFGRCLSGISYAPSLLSKGGGEAGGHNVQVR